VRNPVTTYNPEELAALEKSIPDFPWRRFLAGAGLGDVTRFVVTTKTSVPKLAQIFAAAPLDTLKAWQAFSTIDAAEAIFSRIGPIEHATNWSVPAPLWTRHFPSAGDRIQTSHRLD
jgi:predicted metalloendopeptidase